MDRMPLMPKATAVWLVENTSLSFEQIAVFCGLHVLEVKGIADGDVAQGIKGMDPITSGQLTREEIKRGEDDHDHPLTMAAMKVDIPQMKAKKGPRYTPLSRRQDRPNAILWLLKNHPELKDSQVMRLVGTTKSTIDAIRTRGHWNSANLLPQDPVALGLCSQIDLDAEVKKAARRVERERQEKGESPAEKGGTLLPASETTALIERGSVEHQQLVGEKERGEPVLADGEAPDRHAVARIEADEAKSVFAKLDALKPKTEAEEAADEAELAAAEASLFEQAEEPDDAGKGS